MPKQKIKCPGCGAEMNHHAEKVDYSTALAEPESMDHELGGVVEEIHTCPKCGGVETRRTK